MLLILVPKSYVVLIFNIYLLTNIYSCNLQSFCFDVELGHMKLEFTREVLLV